MANAFKRVAGYLGLVDDEETDLTPAPAVAENPRSVRAISPTISGASSTTKPTYLRQQSAAQHSAPAMATSLPSPSIEAAPMNHIVTIHPRFYSEVRTIGEHYRSGQPVIMNLSDMEESERKRLVDFASGLVFGHHGSIERVTSKVFLLTPPNVKVSTEDKRAAAEASFFNQS
jgi:cell division inhibitor SepF